MEQRHQEVIKNFQNDKTKHLQFKTSDQFLPLYLYNSRRKKQIFQKHALIVKLNGTGDLKKATRFKHTFTTRMSIIRIFSFSFGINLERYFKSFSYIDINNNFYFVFIYTGNDIST